MWLVVHMAKSQVSAEEIRDILAAEGLLVRMRPVYRAVASTENYFEIQVLESERQEAQTLLIEHGV
jgi:uroporphyrinogen-III synthase